MSRLIFQVRELKIKINYYKKKLMKKIDYCLKHSYNNQPLTLKNTCELLKPKSDSSICNKNDISDSSNERSYSKLAVYTCVFGNYDQIKNPFFKSKYCDYYIITDQELPKKTMWKKIMPNTLPNGFESWHPALKNRYYKMHPHELFSDYDYSLYIDGNIRLMTDVYPFLIKLQNEKKILALHKHPIFSCLYDSGEHLKKIDLVDCAMMDKQTNRYLNEGFPRGFGFFECCLILRNHHNESVIRIMNTWWNEYYHGVKRDQQSFTYAIWKNGLTASDICLLGTDIRKNMRVSILDHKKTHEKIILE